MLFVYVKTEGNSFSRVWCCQGWTEGPVDEVIAVIDLIVENVIRHLHPSQFGSLSLHALE